MGVKFNDITDHRPLIDVDALAGVPLLHSRLRHITNQDGSRNLSQQWKDVEDFALAKIPQNRGKSSPSTTRNTTWTSQVTLETQDIPKLPKGGLSGPQGQQQLPEKLISIETIHNTPIMSKDNPPEGKGASPRHAGGGEGRTQFPVMGKPGNRNLGKAPRQAKESFSRDTQPPMS